MDTIKVIGWFILSVVGISVILAVYATVKLLRNIRRYGKSEAIRKLFGEDKDIDR